MFYSAPVGGACSFLTPAVVLPRNQIIARVQSPDPKSLAGSAYSFYRAAWNADAVWR